MKSRHSMTDYSNQAKVAAEIAAKTFKGAATTATKVATKVAATVATKAAATVAAKAAATVATKAAATVATKVAAKTNLRHNALRLTLAILLTINVTLACMPTLANAATITSTAAAEQQGYCLDSEVCSAAKAMTTTTSLITLATDVPYLDINGLPQTVTQATELDGSEATLNAGWYLATGTLNYSGRITISGEVHLILADGATMQASKGIGVPLGSTLSIYAQSFGNAAGSLFSTSAADAGHAGLGGNSESDAGAIVIAGGNIVAAGSSAGGAAIGGGYNSSGGSVTIMGGNVKADGNGGGAGIGSGNGNGFKVLKGGTIVIGGTAVIEAYGGTNLGLGGSAAGIGGGGMPTGSTSIGASSGNITIKDSASVTAVGGNAPGGNAGAGIGGGGSAAGGGSSAGKIDSISITTTGAVIAMGGTGFNPGAGIGTGGGLDVGSGDSEDYPKITATAGVGGSISPAGELTVIGSDITFYITPDSSHLIASVVVDAQDLGAISSYSFSDITGEHTISASFLSKNYEVQLSVTGNHDFANLNYGYRQADITPLEVTLTNSGNVTTDRIDIMLSGENAQAFALSATELADVAPGASERFSVTPITGLDCSAYNATVTVSNDNGISAAFDVSFAVEKSGQLPLEIIGLKANYTYGDAAVPLQTTGGSGSGTVSYASSDTTVASIMEDSVVLHKAGTFTITANKAGDNNYLPTSATSAVVSVASATPTITLSAFGGATTLDTITLSCNVAVAGNGSVAQGIVRFFGDGEALNSDIALSASGEASISIGVLSAGEHRFSVEYLGQPDYYLGGSASLVHTVALSQQLPLEVTGIPAQINYGDAKFTLVASSGSGTGEFEFRASKGNGVVRVAAVSGSSASIEIVGAGQTTITVTKAADDTYALASKEIDVRVTPRDIANTSLAVGDNPIYTGEQLRPVTMVSDDVPITISDYDISYGTNILAGEKSGSVTLTGKGNYTGSKTISFSILRRSLLGASITLSGTEFAYTGLAITPEVLAIEVDGITVSKSEYELSYANNINIGLATVTAKAKANGNFSDSVIATFAIGPKLDSGADSEVDDDFGSNNNDDTGRRGLPKTGDTLQLSGLLIVLSLATGAALLIAVGHSIRRLELRRKL